MVRCCLFVSFLLAQVTVWSQQVSNKPFDFPIRPGTEAWTKFKTTQEMKDACQLPQEILASLTTSALVSTCLDYPRLINVYAYNNLQLGIEKLISDFNGFGQLMQRKDAGSKMLDVYSQMMPSQVSQDSRLEDKGSFAFKYVVLELLLSQAVIINGLSAEDKKRLVSQGLDKFKGKELLLDIYGGQGLATSALVMGRVLDYEHLLESEKSNPDAATSQRAFLDHVEVLDENIILKVIESAQAYIK